MKTEEIFDILGIELTKDENAIKNAYREKLKVTNPEDKPEEFKHLRQAYEEACAYAKKEDEPKEEKDTTPSGVWLEKAATLYESFQQRCNIDAWKALFSDEVFLSLDENEECRKKLLVFMMSHFCFPFAIWKLLDKNLNITKDKEHLKESFPADYVRFIVRRCEEDDGIDYRLFSGPDQGDYDQFLRYYRVAWEALDAENVEAAEQSMEKALNLGITHPYMEIVRARICAMQGKLAETEELLKELIKNNSEDIWLLYQVAEYYWGKDDLEQASTYLKRLKELDENHYMANVRLAHYYERIEDYPAAEECIRMIPHASQDLQLQELLKRINVRKKPILQKKWETEQDINAAQELAQCFYDEKSYFAAFQILERIGKMIPEDKKERYYQLLTGVHMGMAEYDRALDVVGRCKEELDYISRVRIAAYHSMGRGFAKYYDKAVEEYEKMKDSATSDIKLLIEMSQIYQEKEEYEKSLELAKKLLDDFQLEYAWVLMMKAYAGMYDAGGVIYCGKKCLRTFPKLVYPYEEMAKVYYQTGHMDELRELLAKAKEQEIHSIYLNSYAYNGEEIPEGFDIDGELKSFNLFYHVQVTRSANLNAYKYGYPVISKFLRMYPCKALLNRRGLFSMDAKDTEKAMADFREILEEDPADAFAYNNIGCLYKYIGQYEEAITCFNKAIYYMYREDKPEPKDVHYGNLAHTYELLGAYDLALKNYLRIAEEFGKSNETMADLIANYGRCGQTADAKQLIDQRFYLDSNKYKKPFYHYRLHMYAGQWDEAGKYVEQYKQVIIYYTASDKTSALWANYYHMYAWQLILQKQYDEAMKVLEQAIEKSKTPSSRKKDKIDLLINKIFFLSLKQIKKEDVVEEPPKLSKSALFWSKVLSSKKAASEPIREMQDTRKEEEAKLEAEIQNTLEALNKVLDQMCRKQLNNKEPRNPIATQDFFYKERYVKYLEFILALYGEGVEAGEKALAAMEESPRCRLCNHGCCMRLKIARALLLEKQGHAKEAMAIYEQLAKEQPYNAFAQLRLLFAK